MGRPADGGKWGSTVVAPALQEWFEGAENPVSRTWLQVCSSIIPRTVWYPSSPPGPPPPNRGLGHVTRRDSISTNQKHVHVMHSARGYKAVALVTYAELGHSMYGRYLRLECDANKV